MIVKGSVSHERGHGHCCEVEEVILEELVAHPQVAAAINKGINTVEAGASKAGGAIESGGSRLLGFLGRSAGVAGIVLGNPLKLNSSERESLAQRDAEVQQQGEKQTENPSEPQTSTSGAGARKGAVPPSTRDPKRFFSPAEKQELKDKANGKCQTCGTKTSQAQASRPGTTHSRREGQAGHKKAWSKGGRTEVHNGKWQCRGCNQKQGANSQ